MKFILICFAFAFPLSINAQSMEELRSAYLRKDYSIALLGFQKFAEQGDAEAQRYLGSIYTYGNGVAKDENTGLAWYKKSADQNEKGGQFYVGQAYMLGRGVDKNDEIANDYYRKSASQGYPPAIMLLASAYRYGRGVKKDLQMAAGYYQNAIEKEHVPAYYALATMYDAGDGIPADKKEAIRLLKIAITSDNTPTKTTAGMAQKLLDKIFQERPDLAEASSNGRREELSKNSSAAQKTSSINSQNDPRVSCENKISGDPRLSAISNKVPLRGASSISFQMLADQSLPNAQEQQAISMLGNLYNDCVKESDEFRKRNYPSEIYNLYNQFDNAYISFFIDLYNQKISFGKFNSRVQQYDKELKEKIDGLTQQAKVKQAEQDELNRSRANALKEAQQRQEQQRIAEEQRLEQQKAAQQAKIAAVRKQWEARCGFDRASAFEQSKDRYKSECDSLANSARGSLGAMGVVACVMNIDSKAQTFAATAYDACMSGAPN